MELQQLQQIVIIAEEKVLSHAAERLHISQSALTRSVQRLEDELGIPLFDRTKNSMTLNEAGRLFVTHAKHVLSDFQKLTDKMEAFKKRKLALHIATCAPAPLWKLTAELSTAFPDTTITSEMPDETDIVSLLLTEKANLAIVRHQIDSDSILTVPFIDEQLYMQVPLTDPLSKQTSIRFSDLSGKVISEYVHTGFWHQLHRDLIPNAQYIEYQDLMVYTNVMISQKPLTFLTELAHTLRTDMTGCVSLPIIDEAATAHYRLAFLKKNKSILAPIIHWISKECIHW